MNFIRQFKSLTHCQRLAMGSALFIDVVFVIPFAISISHSGEATLTIITEEELPLEFTLEDNLGFPFGPLLLDCRIEVKNGSGRFLTGSMDNMHSYGFASSWTALSRSVAIERVDAQGRLLSREVSRLNHALYLGTIDDPTVQSGRHFFVRNADIP